MPRYYFDTRDNETFIADEIGVDIASLEEVRTMVSTAMAEFARDVLPGSAFRTLAIEVRDDFGPVLLVSLRFEIERVSDQKLT
ncbi:hypothetical protein IVA87_24465 [Bradyrhizobium sp. 147]|uniref:DUF6894 family protein n=1 Tax=unclassified Bradyrhizobium TaxID=2631580 RepID=UPI001FFBB2D7|nr:MULTISPECIES: hypothetical protein [unclassified Bradyrhizobium]MCK1546840.1 hypothetical protein [Bradyrhizobium sp. 179]MCK1626028.1 hypothetical protein [Bradyrhizobium sp. 160]MCK1682476.1 hypothetical protein [Bradyrhizobium sp. 147]